MILSLVLNYLFGVKLLVRAKVRKHLLYVFVVFLTSWSLTWGSFEHLHMKSRHEEAATSLVSFPWIISVEHVPYTVDDWWMTLRFLNYEVHECQVHEIVLFYEPFPFIVNLLFASNRLIGTIGLIIGLKFSGKKRNRHTHDPKGEG